MKIALAGDHAGFTQLKELADYLQSLGYEVKDFGPAALKPDDDYPDFVIPAAKAVASGEFERGIILGGSGQGEAMAANKIKGIRCAVFYGPAVPLRVIDAEGRTSHDPYEIIKLSRQHNDANILSLAARFVALPDMKQAVKLWLDTTFSDKERHQKRLNKISELGS